VPALANAANSNNNCAIAFTKPQPSLGFVLIGVDCMFYPI
jgi:hypothetical protein